MVLYNISLPSYQSAGLPCTNTLSFYFLTCHAVRGMGLGSVTLTLLSDTYKSCCKNKS